MPKDHARKKALADLKADLNIKHQDAVLLMDHPDENERETLEQYLAEYIDITTYREAVDYLKKDPNRQLLCEKCGWTVAMVCPECPGCGCYSGQCSGWRHHEHSYDDEEDEYSNSGCPECGAGGGGDPYGECVCGYYDDEEDEAA